MPNRSAGLLVAAASAALGCSSGEAPQLSPLAQEGREIYQSVCVACHNGNPNLDGALGPANAGASEALLAAKVLRGEYPPGYTPKRPDSNGMALFPYLEPKIPALAAYLAEIVEPAQGAASRETKP
jgi:mono/diheme cytochrome c family protein